MPTEPIRLSDAALVDVHRLAQPLHQSDRSRFLEDIAARLAGERELGDGVVHRVAVEIQKKYLQPPDTVELRRQAASRIAGARLHKPNGNGSGGGQAA